MNDDRMFNSVFQPGDPETHRANKALVLELQTALEHASASSLTGTLARYTTRDYLWHGVYPFEEQRGAEAVVSTFYQPFFEAWERVQRRPDILIAGTSVFGGDWVISMGHFMGMFKRPWLGIPPSGKIAFVRVCEFHRLTGGKISETYLFFDLIAVMKGAGVDPLPPQTGAEFVWPGPRTHDGVVLTPPDDAESAQTLELIERMARDLGSYTDVDMDPDKLAETWHETMIWYGPSGIGSTMGIDGFKRQHQMPFRKALYSGRSHNGHAARFTEGVYGGWVGWPSLKLKVSGGGFMGLPTTNTDIDMRVIDIYRREGDKLAENWVFIDLAHVLKQQGLDVLERMRELLP